MPLPSCRASRAVDARSRRKYRLKDLLRGITAKNVHDEVDTGGPVGREVW
jgi:antitoxin component of MazEF toxin-antitoxin module